MNIECESKIIDELTAAFRFSDAVLRHLVTNVDSAIVEPSHMAKAEEEEGGTRRDRVREDGQAIGDEDDGGRRRERREEPLSAEAEEPVGAEESAGGGR